MERNLTFPNATEGKSQPRTRRRLVFCSSSRWILRVERSCRDGLRRRMQIGEDDRDRNLEANHRKGTEAKPRPFVSGETSKTISFWRLDCLPTTGEPMGGADRFKYSSRLPATVEVSGIIHSLLCTPLIKGKDKRGASLPLTGCWLTSSQPSLSACAALRPLVVFVRNYLCPVLRLTYQFQKLQ